VTRELRVHPDARREFNDAIDYYERESPGLGLIFTNEVDSGFTRIREYPEAAPQVASVFVGSCWPSSLQSHARDARRLSGGSGCGSSSEAPLLLARLTR
jgi:plasmid stabilization system protein ParE